VCVCAVARGIVRLVGGVPELEGRLFCGEFGQAFEPSLQLGRKIGARGGGAGLVDEAEHDADVVSLAGVEEVEEVAVGEFRVSLPGVVGDEDEDLIEIEALSVRKVAFDLGVVVFKPQAGVTTRADGGVERGRVVEAANVCEIGGRLLSESWSCY
jgi:FAD/FMN-containing dehydrogenase